jgi:general secretion pathway protein G
MKLRLKSKTRLALLTIGFIALVLPLIGQREPRMSLRSREAVLRTDLRTMRDAIDNYTLDKQEPPRSLQDLVDAGYLRAIPADPITHKPDWVPVFVDPVLGDPVLSPDLKAQGLNDVHSNSSRVATNGSQYNTW